MSETVTIEEAIQNGHKTITKPVRVIQIITFALGVFVCYQLQFPGWTYLGIIPVGVIVPWIYWSFMITKWRIWAFDNVRDVHGLKARAIREKLIWPDGSVFEKTEIRSSADKEKLRLIQRKFEQVDI